MNLPHLTRDFAGIGGTIKQRPEDFFVQEIPLYEPSGEGEHVYCEIQKVGWTTFDAINQVARKLGISSRDIGYAGLKDAKAVTRQIFSIPGTTEADVMALQIPNITPLWAARHGNKLRLGHLSANRFAIKIRDVNPTDVVKLKPVMELLQKRGMPNYFGEQRFGRRGDNHKLGAALIRGDDAGLINLLLGDPDPARDDERSLEARTKFAAGDYEGSIKAWPHYAGLERNIVQRFAKTNSATAAVKAVSENLRKLWISALQSDLFNQVVAARIDSLDRLLNGDLAWKHENGACFSVEDTAAEQPRCDAFEISPTGPLVGYRMTMPKGEALEIEQRIFTQAAIQPDHFRESGRHKISGARRPLRVQPRDVELAAGVDEHGPHITIAFTLAPGSFATVLLDELMKSDSGTGVSPVSG